MRWDVGEMICDSLCWFSSTLFWGGNCSTMLSVVWGYSSDVRGLDLNVVVSPWKLMNYLMIDITSNIWVLKTLWSQ